MENENAVEQDIAPEPLPIKKFPLTPIILCLVVVGVLIGVLMVVFRSKLFIGQKSESTQTQIQTDSKLETKKTTASLPYKREVGTAGALYPYGKVEEFANVEVETEAFGGSVEIPLRGNVTAYVIYPMGMAEGRVFTFTPYFSMPTAKDAVPLSNELGYGLDIYDEGAKYDEFSQSMYLVFSLDQGKTIKEIQKDPKRRYFCDPSIQTFNPSACALLSKVPLSQHTNDTYAVVNPIRSTNLTSLMRMNATIPIGYDNLIVSEITTQGTYIPQRLTPELLVDLIKANAINGRSNIHRVEAGVQLVKNNLYTPENIDGMWEALYGTTAIENIKLAYVLPQFESYIKKLQSGTDLSEKDTQIAKVTNFDNYSRVKEKIVANMKSLLGTISEMSSDRNHSTHVITAAALLRRIEKEKLADVSLLKKEFITQLNDDYEYYKDEEDTDYLMNIFQSLSILHPEIYPQFSQLKPQLSFMKKVLAEGDAAAVDGELKEKARDKANSICSNPERSTWQKANALEVLGQSGGSQSDVDSCAAEICSSIQNRISQVDNQTKGEILIDFKAHQKYCADGESNNEAFAAKLRRAAKKQACHTLLSKTLKTFGDNRINCAEVVNVEDKPTLNDIKSQMKQVRVNAERLKAMYPDWDWNNN